MNLRGTILAGLVCAQVIVAGRHARVCYDAPGLTLRPSTIIQPQVLPVQKEERPEPIQSLRPGGRILLLGDSLAMGMTKRWRSLAKENGYEFSVEAKGGTRVDQWGPKVKSIVSSKKPDIMVVSLGTNDAGMSNPESQRNYVRTIVDVVTKSCVIIVWVLPPPLPESLRGRDKMIEIISNELSNKGIIFDSNQATSGRAKDGIHYSTQGYSDWTDSIWQELIQQKVIGYNVTSTSSNNCRQPNHRP